jgi:hypothetical protein
MITKQGISNMNDFVATLPVKSVESYYPEKSIETYYWKSNATLTRNAPFQWDGSGQKVRPEKETDAIEPTVTLHLQNIELIIGLIAALIFVFLAVQLFLAGRIGLVLPSLFLSILSFIFAVNFRIPTLEWKMKADV